MQQNQQSKSSRCINCTSSRFAGNTVQANSRLTTRHAHHTPRHHTNRHLQLSDWTDTEALQSCGQAVESARCLDCRNFHPPAETIKRR